MSKLLSEEWKKVRDARPEGDHRVDNTGDTATSLYERLKEQKRKQMELELEEAKASNAVRVVEKEDLEFFEQIEEAKRNQEEQLRLQVESQVHLFTMKQQRLQSTATETTPVPVVPQPPPSSSAGVSKQKALLKGAILKGKRSQIEKRVKEEND